MDYEDEDFYGSEGTISDCCNTSEDNNDNDDDVGEFEYSENSNKEERNSIVLSEADMRQSQAALIDTVSAVLSLPKADASIILRYFRWNLNRVEEAWFSDEDKVRNSVGLLCNGPVIEPPVVKNIRCGICYEKKRVGRFRTTGCGHLFCLSCWKRYVNMSIRDGPGCLKLRCPAPKCNVAVNQDMIYELVYNCKGKEKYDRFLLGSYVEGSEKIKWCPGPGCEYAIEFDGGGDVNDVFCSCRYGFCWNCTQDAHRPVDCDTVDQWMKKNEAESENVNWILAYTKPCPQCKRTIEKNEGCMHMTCGEPCKFEFCWLCLGPWVDHKSFYECNKFEKEKKEGKVTDEDRRRDAARVVVERYTHYYERWNANDLSRKKAIQELRKVETESLEELSQKLNKPITQLEFIAEAWVQIIECRRVLKWTYAYGYYMPENEEAKKRLFEYLQGQAEAGLERLHHCTEIELGGYLNGDESANDFYAFRMKLKGLTSVTGTYFDNLVKALENGLSDVDSQGTDKVTALEDPINA